MEATPSRTAYRVALRRAAHQVFDEPVVFHDPLALRILGITRGRIALHELRAPRRPYSRSLRAFVVARSCFAEEAMRDAARAGCTQYVLLGAGLDTYAYRNRDGAVTTYEVDHPATQMWKRGLLEKNGITVPETCRYVSVDFERDNLREALNAAGFRWNRSAVFAWLGVVPYLSPEAMRSTLEVIAGVGGEATLLLDYTLPRFMLAPNEQLALDSLSARVAQAGEPFRQFFSPEAIRNELGSFGFTVEEDLHSAAINARYFQETRDREGLGSRVEQGGADSIRVLGTGAHLLLARRVGALNA